MIVGSVNFSLRRYQTKMRKCSAVGINARRNVEDGGNGRYPRSIRAPIARKEMKYTAIERHNSSLMIQSIFMVLPDRSGAARYVRLLAASIQLTLPSSPYPSMVSVVLTTE